MLGTKILAIKKSKYNGILKVVKSWGLGTYIQSDGLTQSGGIVEGMWKQVFRKIHRSRCVFRNVLILGYGGGTVAKIVNKHFPDAKITGVDIDKEIVFLGRKYLKSDILNTEVKISDAENFLLGLDPIPDRNTFDLIIIDLYNGDQFPKKFESDRFPKLARRALSDCGIAIFNRLYYKDKISEADNFGKKLRGVFKDVTIYKPTVNIMFFCSN